LTAAVPTVAVLATFTTHANVSDELVYAAVKSMFENFDELKKLHPSLSNLDPAKMVTQGLTAPLHPGALRYYKEKGWL
jgi:TRAP transporter TAXI family solute receptor